MGRRLWLGKVTLFWVRLGFGHGEVTLVGLGDFILGEVRLGYECYFMHGKNYRLWN